MTVNNQATRLQPDKVHLRRATPADAEICGVICHEAFRHIAESHNFAPDFPNASVAQEMLAAMFSIPQFYAVVAEVDGNLVGSNVLWEGDAIAAIGPITVSPRIQNSSIGKRLMIDVIERARELEKPGVRLVQSAYHARSLSLYAKLGFVVREPLAVIQGKPPRVTSEHCAVRPAAVADLSACNQLCLQVHGYDRGNELAVAIHQGTATLVEHQNRITAYSTTVGFLGHCVAESNEDLKFLIASAESFAGPGILVPMRNAPLFRWCLNQGLRVGFTMNLMSIGLYNEPQGAWLPSVAC